MTQSEIRDRLLLIARDRLRNRPGAYGQFQHAIENTVRGVAMTSAAHLMPHVWQVGEQMGNQKATELVREHLMRIVDEWAQSQPLPPAVEPLPGAEPPAIGPARADTRDTATPAPLTDRPSSAPAWTVNKPQRYSGYAAPLHRLLAAAHRDGNPCPTARDVVEAWRNNAPAEIAKVLPDGFDYYDAKGNTKTADLEAIRKAIGRMTIAR